MALYGGRAGRGRVVVGAPAVSQRERLSERCLSWRTVVNAVRVGGVRRQEE